MADDTAVNSYDQILYPSFAVPQSHPDRLATLATLFGMEPAPVGRCRVLELGCGDGSNLLPLAAELPESQFLGIDLAARPIEIGRERARGAGLKNLTLRRLDLMDVADDLGRFDYVIAHGLYSWVPPAVQDRVLAVCRAHLAPRGVAFVSYNAYPGGHLRDMLREMMLFHTRHLDEPRQRIAQARALLKFLHEARREGDEYQMVLKKEVERVIKFSEDHLFHDDLEEFNLPVYFYQFVEHAGRHGLQYLAEADYYEMQDQSLPAEAVEKLRQLADDVVLREQYADFIKCRRFRQTLLCHRDVAVEREQRPEQVRRFWVASPARPARPAPDVKSSAPEKFVGLKGATIETDHPLAKAAVLHLGERWPMSVPFDELLAGVRERLGTGHGRDAAHDEEDSL
ncbi:MAG: methyltransferase regulatory domain-containing protein, partial [Pyrinomonadaceae bacterium]